MAPTKSQLTGPAIFNKIKRDVAKHGSVHKATQVRGKVNGPVPSRAIMQARLALNNQRSQTQAPRSITGTCSFTMQVKSGGSGKRACREPVDLTPKGISSKRRVSGPRKVNSLSARVAAAATRVAAEGGKKAGCQLV